MLFLKDLALGLLLACAKIYPSISFCVIDLVVIKRMVAFDEMNSLPQIIRKILTRQDNTNILVWQLLSCVTITAIFFINNLYFLLSKSNKFYVITILLVGFVNIYVKL